MYTSTILTSALAALVVLAPTATKSSAKAFPSDLFALKTIPRNSARTEFSKYLSSSHVGAGQSAVVGTHDCSQSRAFYINPNTGRLTGYTPSTSLPPATIGVECRVPYNSSAPAGNNYISSNNGSGGTKVWVVIPNPDGTGVRSSMKETLFVVLVPKSRLSQSARSRAWPLNLA
ncbi:hypothetical protein FH972_023900 [Carpinus fangiana]|uniref:DUF7907 domain-containing protein n=1 Tax=Carpinus fangiana TaxID=176857 RepID=A0A5N6KWR8_9ROSI|nr:hypothetical protein FH972_023900 [Carpinus fangiana]